MQAIVTAAGLTLALTLPELRSSMPQLTPDFRSVSTHPTEPAQQEDAEPFTGVAATNFIQWSEDEQRLLTGSPSGDLLFFDAASGALVTRIAGGDAYCAFAVFLPGEAQVAASDYAGRLTVYDVASGKRLARQRGHDAEIAGTAVSSDGQTLVTSDKDGDAVVWSWSGTALKVVRRIENAVDDFANQVTLSPDGALMGVSGSASRADGTGEVSVYSTKTGSRVMRVVTPAFANSVEFSAKGDVIYVGTARGKVRGLMVASGGPASQPGGSGPQGIANARVVANDIALFYDARGPAGSYAACGDGKLRRVRFDGSTLWSSRADRSTCYFAALSPSGKRIATSGTEGALRIFGENGELLREIGGR
ncbi:MAG: hypothetical protein AAGG01_11160 [Planctomycetota bacterium]